MSHFLDQLNPSQRAAVEHIDGPSLVIAGAGSGKTRVLTYKVAYLMEQGISPYSILALTFTNKSAREMKARIAHVTGDFEARHLWMGTFHSIFSRILRAEAATLGFPASFTIYDSSDSKSLINNIIKSNLNLDNKHYKPKVVQTMISLAKNSLITPSAYANDEKMQIRDKSLRLPHLTEIYRIYMKRCKAAGAMDFDDLLLYTNILFRDHPAILEKYQDMFKFILVDEYQDTNYAQFLIVRQLAKVHEHLAVVGDDAQSIYSFRGARLDNMLNFPKIFKKTKVYKLEQNYRSTKNIVKAANSLIAKNKEQFDKKTFSENEEGSLISINHYYSDQEEGFSVARKISDMMSHGDQEYSDFAILYRTNSQSRNLEEALRKIKIPYKIYGGRSFYQRKEIKDLLAYFRISANECDNEALKRIINTPARGIGNTTQDKVEIAANMSGNTLLEVCLAPLENKVEVNTGTAKKLMAFAEMIKTFQALINETPAHEMAERILNDSGTLKAYSDQADIENLGRKDNIQEILNALTIYEKENLKDEEIKIVTITNFLEEVALLTDQDESEEDEENNKVTMMTVHASKGLEFKNVFIVGMEKELFPSLQSMESPRQYEEERRLFYVAITRAEENCFLTYAKSRFQWGKATNCMPSPFLRDIDPQYVTTPSDVSFKTKRTIQREQAGPTSDLQKAAAIRTQQARQRNIVSPNFTPSDTNDIATGQQVEHARFGIGKVIAMEGQGDSTKATIFFQKNGQKNLLLKFAKLRIVK